MALYTPENIRRFAENDLLLDLRPYVKKYSIPINDIYSSSKLPYVCQKASLWVYPKTATPYACSNNRKLFREAGVPFPRTSIGLGSEVSVSQARKLTKSKDG